MERDVWLLQPVVLSAWLVLAGLTLTESTAVTMTTRLGNLTGNAVMHQAANVSVFYGVPYAKPPVGDLRFKPPEPAESWTGTRDARSLPNSCWQNIDTSFNRTPNVEMWNANTNRSEDCLYLNIWIPDAPGLKAVLVWIYGGGFWGGTATLDAYNGLTLAARNQVIVVSFNYRVGPFGFLYCGTADCPGNVGLLDQVMAMTWVKENIAQMGGDSTRITIFGESAGAASVGFHLLSSLSVDLFTTAMMMSSSPTVHWGIQSHDVALNRTQTLASLLDPSVRSISSAVSYLRSASAQTLAKKQWELVYYYFDTPFAPVVDGRFLPKHPMAIISEGKIKNTTIVMGVVKNEGTYWLLYGFSAIFKNRDPNPVSYSQYATVVEGLLRPMGSNFTLDSVKDFTIKEYYDAVPPWSRGSYLDATDAICGDTLFKCPVVNFAQYYSSKVKGKVFMYSFEQRSSIISWPQWLGVPHGYELDFFFGRPWSDMRDSYTDGERSLSDDVMTRISNFVKTGDPNSGSKTPTVTWPAYTSEEQRYLVMNIGQTHVEQGLRFRECQFWDMQVPLLQTAAFSRQPCVGGATCLSPKTIPVTIIGSILAVVVFHI